MSMQRRMYQTRFGPLSGADRLVHMYILMCFQPSTRHYYCKVCSCRVLVDDPVRRAQSLHKGRFDVLALGVWFHERAVFDGN